jgi:hypothetical protein
VSFEASDDSVFEEHSCELPVSKGQSPETEVRGSVGNGTKGKLDRLNELMDEDVSERRSMAVDCWMFSEQEVFNSEVSNVLGLWLVHLYLLCINHVFFLLAFGSFWLGLFLQLNVVWLNVMHGMVRSDVLLMFAVENNRLGEKHHWYADHSSEEAENAQTLLKFVRSQD